MSGQGIVRVITELLAVFLIAACARSIYTNNAVKGSRQVQFVSYILLLSIGLLSISTAGFSWMDTALLYVVRAIGAVSFLAWVSTMVYFWNPRISYSAEERAKRHEYQLRNTKSCEAVQWDGYNFSTVISLVQSFSSTFSLTGDNTIVLDNIVSIPLLSFVVVSEGKLCVYNQVSFDLLFSKV